MDKNIIDSYLSVKAPSSLKTRLDCLDTVQKPQKASMRKNLLRTVSSGIAACFLIAVVLTLALRTGKTDVNLTYGDTVIGETPVALTIGETAPASFGMRSINYSGIPFELSLGGKSKVSVSDGTLYVFNAKTEELVSVVTDITLSEDALVRWDISGIDNTGSALSVEANGETYVYLLTFENGEYYICLSD